MHFFVFLFARRKITLAKPLWMLCMLHSCLWLTVFFTSQIGFYSKLIKGKKAWIFTAATTPLSELILHLKSTVLQRIDQRFRKSLHSCLSVCPQSRSASFTFRGRKSRLRPKMRLPQCFTNCKTCCLSFVLELKQIYSAWMSTMQSDLHFLSTSINLKTLLTKIWKHVVNVVFFSAAYLQYSPTAWFMFYCHHNK